MRKLTTTLVILLNSLLAHGQQPTAIHSDISGKGQTVLFLPGFTSPGSVWDGTIANLKGEYEIIKISYAGFNGLEPIAAPWYESIKQELISFVKERDIRNAIIIGHSMGGNLAVDLAAVFPNRIHKIIMVDAIPCMREIMMPGTSSDQIQYDSPYNQRMIEMPDEAFKQMASMMAQQMASNPDHVENLVQWSMDADRETYVYGFTDLLKLDLRKVLLLVKAPTLILGAPFPNEATVKANFEVQYTLLTNKQLEIASNSKHFIMLDQPQWFYDKVNAFLDND